MASPTGDRTLAYHRRLALESMPPSELRDDYLLYLDDLERRAQAAARPPDRETPAPRPRAGEATAAPAWTVQRSIAAAALAIFLAGGTWLLTSLL